MKTPTIHLNGTPVDSLIEQYTTAYVRAQELLDALAAIDLHARDYYIRPDGQADFQQACEESAARYMAVKNIRAEMQDFILAIQKQQDAR